MLSRQRSGELGMLGFAARTCVVVVASLNLASSSALVATYVANKRRLSNRWKVGKRSHVIDHRNYKRMACMTSQRCSTNVETFCWVPSIVLKKDGQWFVQAGAREQFRGRRFFSISGDVNCPGAYEVPNGITVQELIDQYAGGIRDGHALKAIALSGPSGGFTPIHLPADAVNSRFLDSIGHEGDTFDIRDFPLDIRTSRMSGIMLGAQIVVYDETRDIADQAWACSRFFHSESCGKCVPCRLGSQQIEQMAHDALIGRMGQELLPIVETLSAAMQVGSICGLGMVAANPLKTLLRFFPDELPDP